MPTPDPKSAQAAVETLRHELDAVTSAIESTDRKAALVPAVLGAIAGLFIAPDLDFSTTASALLIAAFSGATFAEYHTLQEMRAHKFRLGPDANTLIENVPSNPAMFDWGIAAADARAIEANSEIAGWKGRHLNLSLFAAYVTILLLALARILG